VRRFQSVTNSDIAINAICPYFTMFPIEFPLQILRKRGQAGQRVLDPFCGRGTTNLAARIMGLHSVGIDSSAVAAAIAASKLVNVEPIKIVQLAGEILSSDLAVDMPQSDFWQLAFHRDVLKSLCCLRAELLRDCGSAARVALRGILLGALHGPQQKSFPSYLSNQSPRTFSPKPRYSVQYWKKHRLMPQEVNVIDVIKRRAERYYKGLLNTNGVVRLADSRKSDTFKHDRHRRRFDWIITSPPYYGMRTYIPDQWIRNWFVGGSDSVDYSNERQLSHNSPEVFTNDLAAVWRNVRTAATDEAKLVVRFGGIPDRKAEPLGLIKESLRNSGWRISTIRSAGNASEGRRQADSFLKKAEKAICEYDVWAVAE
jgi:SAM-dependent methyltransferase